MVGRTGSMNIKGSETGLHSVEVLDASQLVPLGKREILALFRKAEAPDPTRLAGEHEGTLLTAGVLSPFVPIYVHHLFGHGRWLGKGFEAAGVENEGTGYNIFRGGKRTGWQFLHERRFRTYLAKSRFDENLSLHIDYSPFNRGLAGTLHDELRLIPPSLYLGLGCSPLMGGKHNPFAFALSSAKASWSDAT